MKLPADTAREWYENESEGIDVLDAGGIPSLTELITRERKKAFTMALSAAMYECDKLMRQTAGINPREALSVPSVAYDLGQREACQVLRLAIAEAVGAQSDNATPDRSTRREEDNKG